MRLTIVFKQSFAEDMKKQFGDAFSNPLVVHGVKSLYMENGYLHSVIWDDRRWRLSDISQFHFEEEQGWD